VTDVDPDDMVYIVRRSTGGSQRVHTDRYCPAFTAKDETKVVEIRRGDRPDYELCRRCSGEWAENQAAPQSHPHDLLRKLSPDEIDLSSTRCDREVGGS
jgi:hypothetical protein